MDWHAWTAAVVAVVGALANANRRRWGFALWACTNSYLAVRNADAGEWAQACLWTVNAGVSVWGWCRWGVVEREMASVGRAIGREVVRVVTTQPEREED